MNAGIDPLAAFKAAQKQGWAHFVPFELSTIPCAARLVRFAGVQAGQRVLDVAGGTGVVAITAALAGAKVTGSDFTPELLERARENARIAEVDVPFHEADVESLPFGDREYDVVLSQFGHMFAPRPEVAISEMLRVLKPGGTIGFSTWPPHHFVGRMFALTASFMPPPPPGVAPPVQWGDPDIVRERLGAAVRELVFENDFLIAPALSPRHPRWNAERHVGAIMKVVETLEGSDPAKLAEFRRAYDALAAQYRENNVMRQLFMMSRAIKVA